MKTTTLEHRHGGTITELTAIGHDTYKGVASWHFRGNVQWHDGSQSQDTEVPPMMVCKAEGAHDDELTHILSELTDYLQRNGRWHESKQTRDGRVYSWTPHKPSGREPLKANATQMSLL